MNNNYTTLRNLVERADAGLTLDVALAEGLLTGFIQNELGKVGFQRAVVALSGGIDSAVVCALVSHALGPENVLALMMPYRTSNSSSRADAETLISQLGVKSTLLDITDMVTPYFDSQTGISNLRRGNVMARTRMIVVYDHSEAFGGLVIGTSNKSEILLGYGTLFGDMASAINPIGDLFKTQVRQLARGLQLPSSIIEKAPSADLWEGQSDEADLGMSYDEVDRILYLLFDERFPRSELLGAGFSEQKIAKVYRMVQRNQFKRRPPIIAKISDRTVEREFRYPRDWGL